MDTEVIELFSRLDDAGITYCIAHDWLSLPQHVRSDIDVIVERDALSHAICVIEEVFGDGVVQVLPCAVGQRTVVIYRGHNAAPPYLNIDVAVDLRLRGCIAVSGEEILQKRMQVRGMWVSSAAEELRYLVAKKLLKGEFPVRQMRRCQDLCSELTLDDARETLNELLGPKGGRALHGMLLVGDWRGIQRALTGFRRALRGRRVMRDPVSILRYWIPELQRWLRRMMYPTGLVVAVLGPDGSGKSSLIRRASGLVRGAFRGEKRFHWRPGVVPRWSRHMVGAPHRLPPYGRVSSIGKLLAVAIDFAVGYWLQVWLCRVRSGVVWFDRYYEDLLVDPVRYRYGAGLRWVWLLRRVVPKPDVWLILDSTQLEGQRKQEVSRAEGDRQAEAYADLAQRLQGATCLDASVSEVEVSLRAAEVILNRLRRRWQVRRSEGGVGRGR